ncbi:sodium-dependent glucose transporter 1B-like [Liolophura sinensis]|uniref:sodium-dependent glucose transporter 1B-like n=1 Tax=Liolophura sinensis TaxID=3198878 RepID=UPI0031590EFB
MHKLLAEAEYASDDDTGENAIARAFGSRFHIPLDFELLDSYMPLYQSVLADRLEYKLTFNDYGRIGAVKCLPYLLSVDVVLIANASDFELTVESLFGWEAGLVEALPGVHILIGGLKIALLGVTFLDLVQRTETDVKTGSYLFVVSGLGSMLGSVVAGFLCDRGYAHDTLTSGLVITGVFGALIPWPKSFFLLLSVNFVVSVGLGFTETVVPFLVAKLWDGDQAAYTQAAYFCFSAGGILGPVIAEPFLNPLLTTSRMVRNVSSSHLSLGNLTSEVSVTYDAVANDVGRIYIPFFISGAITLLSAALWTTGFCSDRHRYNNSRTNSVEMENSTSHTDSSELKRYALFFFLALVAVFFVLYDSVEDGFQNYVTTILVDSMDWSKSDGAKATSVFWGCYTCGKVVGFFLARMLEPFKLVMGCFLGLNTVWVLLIWFLQSESVLSWILIALLGLFMSPLYPISMSIANTYISSGMVSSIIITSSDLGCLLNPIVIGHLLQSSSEHLASRKIFSKNRNFPVDHF